MDYARACSYSGRYSEARIWDYVPSTSPNLLKPYNP